MFMATLEQMQAWAAGIMASRPRDFVIGADYMHRWWAIPRNEFANVYLHRIMHSDDDRALHDHPWDNISVVLSGRYLEHMPGMSGPVERKAGDVVTRRARDAHRLEMLPGEEAISLFITGPKVREWGFHCPKGWVPWFEFVDARDTGQIGRGCGE